MDYGGSKESTIIMKNNSSIFIKYLSLENCKVFSLECMNIEFKNLNMNKCWFFNCNCCYLKQKLLLDNCKYYINKNYIKKVKEKHFELPKMKKCKYLDIRSCGVNSLLNIKLENLYYLNCSDNSELDNLYSWKLKNIEYLFAWQCYNLNKIILNSKYNPKLKFINLSESNFYYDYSTYKYILKILNNTYKSIYKSKGIKYQIDNLKYPSKYNISLNFFDNILYFYLINLFKNVTNLDFISIIPSLGLDGDDKKNLDDDHKKNDVLFYNWDKLVGNSIEGYDFKFIDIIKSIFLNKDINYDFNMS